MSCLGFYILDRISTILIDLVCVVWVRYSADEVMRGRGGFGAELGVRINAVD